MTNVLLSIADFSYQRPAHQHGPSLPSFNTEGRVEVSFPSPRRSCLTSISSPRRDLILYLFRCTPYSPALPLYGGLCAPTITVFCVSVSSCSRVSFNHLLCTSIQASAFSTKRSIHHYKVCCPIDVKNDRLLYSPLRSSSLLSQITRALSLLLRAQQTKGTRVRNPFTRGKAARQCARGTCTE